MQNHNTTKSKVLINYWDQINLTIDISAQEVLQNSGIIVHDLKGAAGAFTLLVEELESGLNEQSTSRQRTKVAQLKKHAIINTLAIQKLTEVLNSCCENHPLYKEEGQ